MIKFFQKIKKGYREGGILLVLKRLFKKAFGLNSAYWYERQLSLPILNQTTKIPLKFDMYGGNKTLEWLKADNDRSWMLDCEDEIKVALEQGHYFPNVKYKEKIIGSAKVGFKKVYIVDFKKNIYFSDGIAFQTDIYVGPKYRGMGVGPYLITEIIKFFKKNNFKIIRCHIPVWNNASIRAHTKVGFKKIRRIWCFRIFSLRIITGDPTKEIL